MSIRQVFYFSLNVKEEKFFITQKANQTARYNRNGILGGAK